MPGFIKISSNHLNIFQTNFSEIISAISAIAEEPSIVVNFAFSFPGQVSR
jgi:hypothetical protein